MITTYISNGYIFKGLMRSELLSSSKVHLFFSIWPTVSVRVAIKINGYNCGSVSPLCSPTHRPFPPSPFLFSLAVVRMPADEDRTTQAQHIHHPLPAVDHCHRAHLPCGDPRGEASEARTPLSSQSRKTQIIYMQRICPHC